MDIRSKMTDAFRTAQGGLFSAVEKADVGSAYQELERRGVALMGWADPFMPDRSLPDFIEQAWLDAVRQDAAPHYTARGYDQDISSCFFHVFYPLLSFYREIRMLF